MKTDLQLQRDVLEELKFEPSIREAEIGVATKGGVVTLTGFVDSYAEKFSAERTAERVNGVKAVADDIKVKLPGSFQRSDTDIAHAVVNALRWDIQVPDDRIKASVDDGWIDLEGEVEWLGAHVRTSSDAGAAPSACSRSRAVASVARR